MLEKFPRKLTAVDAAPKEPTEPEYVPKIPRGWTYLKHGTNRVRWDDDKPCAGDELVLTRPLSTVTKEDFEKDVEQGRQGTTKTYSGVTKPLEMSDADYLRKNVPFEIRVYFFENHPRSNKDPEYRSRLDEETMADIAKYYFNNRQLGRHPLIPKHERLIKVGEATENGMDVFYYVPEKYKERYDAEIADV